MVDHGGVVGTVALAAIVSSRRITDLSADVIAELVADLGRLWHERHQAKLASRLRKRGVGAGAKYRLEFVDRLLATLIYFRHEVTHDVLACWFGVDRSTITRAIGEVRPLLAERGCTIRPGVRLRTLAEVIDQLPPPGERPGQTAKSRWSTRSCPADHAARQGADAAKTRVSNETDSMLCLWVEPWGNRSLDASGRGVHRRGADSARGVPVQCSRSQVPQALLLDLLLRGVTARGRPPAPVTSPRVRMRRTGPARQRLYRPRQRSARGQGGGPPL